MDKKPLNTHCEIRRVQNGEPKWELISVEDALGLDNAGSARRDDRESGLF
jgi:hypothetical protein